jgi:hypothetical protein
MTVRWSSEAIRTLKGHMGRKEIIQSSALGALEVSGEETP